MFPDRVYQNIREAGLMEALDTDDMGEMENNIYRK